MAKMVTHMLYLVLAVGFKWCRNYLYLSEELLKGNENLLHSRWVFWVVHLQYAARGLPSIRVDKGHGGACSNAKRVQHPLICEQKKKGLWTRDKDSHLTRQKQTREKSLKRIGKPYTNTENGKCKHIVIYLFCFIFPQIFMCKHTVMTQGWQSKHRNLGKKGHSWS